MTRKDWRRIAKIITFIHRAISSRNWAEQARQINFALDEVQSAIAELKIDSKESPDER